MPICRRKQKASVVRDTATRTAICLPVIAINVNTKTMCNIGKIQRMNRDKLFWCGRREINFCSFYSQKGTDLLLMFFVTHAQGWRSKEIWYKRVLIKKNVVPMNFLKIFDRNLLFPFSLCCFYYMTENKRTDESRIVSAFWFQWWFNLN